MRKLLPTILITVAMLCGCATVDNTIITENEKIKIVATLFPHYDFARQVAGEYAEVTLLLPPGVESHAFDPKPGDISNIYTADMFVYTGEVMEPWAERILKGVDTRSGLLVVDIANGITLYDLSDDDHDNHDADDVHHDNAESHGADAHIWLNPLNCIDMIDNITQALMELDSSHTQEFLENAEAYKKQLRQLDIDYIDMISEAKRDTLVFGGRFAYIYFLDHYKLKYKTAYQTCSLETEPSVRQITEVIRFVDKNNIPYIFHEEFVDPKIAKSIAKETGAETLVFNTAHNVTGDELAEGITYIDIMMNNLENLRLGLN